MISPDPLSDLNRPILAPEVRFQTDPISREPILLFPEGLLVLNATAADILARCDGATSLAEILAQMQDEYEVEEAALKRDVMECVADLNRRGLLLLRP